MTSARPGSREFLSALAAVGKTAQDHRASVANTWRRRDRGDTPETCAGCGCETDVDPQAHAVRCPA